MKIAVLSLAIGEAFKRKVKYAQLSKALYCRKHSYDYIDDESVYDSSRPHAWSKILLIKKYLPSYDYVVWIDADALIADQEQTLESKIPLMNGKDIMVVSDWKMINTGVMFVRNTPASMLIMDLVYAQTQFITAGDWEQTAFIHVYDNDIGEVRKHIEVKPHAFEQQIQCYFTAFYPGCFILHLAGFRADVVFWVTNKIFERFYPYKLDDETDEHYIARLKWVKDETVACIRKYREGGRLDLLYD